MALDGGSHAELACAHTEVGRSRPGSGNGRGIDRFQVFGTGAEAGAMPEPTAAPLTLYWILLVIGLIAAALGFYVRRPKP
jgi:hypothetical protein